MGSAVTGFVLPFLPHQLLFISTEKVVPKHDEPKHFTRFSANC
jgi:hypothetical protein